MGSSLDAQLEFRASVWRRARGRAAEHVTVPGDKRSEIGGVTLVLRPREGESRSFGGECDAADEDLRAISKRGSRVGKTSEGVRRPSGLGGGGEGCR